jgi:type I restriction enzyme S subunit
VFHAEGSSTTITHLTDEQLSSRRFPFPDPEIQQQVTAALDAQAEGEKALREARTKQLALLGERREALITAAVTGAIDVTTARG